MKQTEENHMENTSLNSIENDEDKNNQKVDSSNGNRYNINRRNNNKRGAIKSEENTEDVTTKEAPSE